MCVTNCLLMPYEAPPKEEKPQRRLHRVNGRLSCPKCGAENSLRRLHGVQKTGQLRVDVLWCEVCGTRSRWCYEFLELGEIC